MRCFHGFLRDESGAITIDWVSLTAGILLLGIMVVYSIFNGGVSSLVVNINDTLAAVELAVVGGTGETNSSDVGGLMSLPNELGVQTGSTVVDTGPLHITFDAGGGNLVTVWTDNWVDSGTLAVGSKVTSSTSFTTPDGSTVSASSFKFTSAHTGNYVHGDDIISYY